MRDTVGRGGDAELEAQVRHLAEFIGTQIDLLSEMISDESLFPNIRGIRQGVEDIGSVSVFHLVDPDGNRLIVYAENRPGDTS